MDIKAAVLRNKNNLELLTISKTKLVEGQVLVKVLFSGVCRSQLMEVRGLRGKDQWLPHLLGHEGSGVVQEVGPGVTKVSSGDEVILTWIKGEGLEAPGAQYRCGEQTINSGQVTTFSNYTVVSENRVVKKPVELPFDTAVLFGCALPTGARMVLNEMVIKPESNVVVLGLGGIGLSALLTAKYLGVRQLIAVDVAENKLEIARKWGVEHVFHSKDENLQEKILQLTDGGANFCIESAGRVESIELGFSFIRKGGGKLIFASHPQEGETIKLNPHELISGKQIAGSWGGASQPDRDIPRIHKLLSKASQPLNSLLTKRYLLENINEALDDLEAGIVFRPLIKMEHPE